jgi:hypothetical protein
MTQSRRRQPEWTMMEKSLSNGAGAKSAAGGLE